MLTREHFCAAPIINAAQLAFHLGKEVAVREKFAPNVGAFGPAVGEFVKASKNAINVKHVRSFLAGSLLMCCSHGRLVLYSVQVSNLTMRDLAVRAVVFAEVLGFFTLGEIIGRRSLVGYKVGSVSH